MSLVGFQQSDSPFSLYSVAPCWKRVELAPLKNQLECIHQLWLAVSAWMARLTLTQDDNQHYFTFIFDQICPSMLISSVTTGKTSESSAARSEKRSSGALQGLAGHQPPHVYALQLGKPAVSPSGLGWFTEGLSIPLNDLQGLPAPSATGGTAKLLVDICSGTSHF